MKSEEPSVTGEGFTVTITRSAGLDGAVVIFVDGPMNGEGETRDEMPDGAPRCRIYLNDEPVYKAVPFGPVPDAEELNAPRLPLRRRFRHWLRALARMRRA